MAPSRPHQDATRETITTHRDVTPEMLAAIPVTLTSALRYTILAARNTSLMEG